MNADYAMKECTDKSNNILVKHSGSISATSDIRSMTRHLHVYKLYFALALKLARPLSIFSLLA